MLWYDFQEVEYDIISNKICNYLYKKYGVTPVTVHDAIYITDEDRKKVKESIEDIFWRELDLKYLKKEKSEDKDENIVTAKEDFKSQDENTLASLDQIIEQLQRCSDIHKIEIELTNRKE